MSLNRDSSTDYSFDGFSNLFERAIGSDSLGPDDWMNLPFRPRLKDGKQRISFVRYKSPLATTGEEFIYHVEQSLDLRTWTKNGISLERSVELGAEMERVVYVTNDTLPAGARRFMRLRITTP